jgi:hypothetical protein
VFPNPREEQLRRVDRAAADAGAVTTVLRRYLGERGIEA